MGLYEFIVFLYVSMVQRNARIALADTSERIRNSSNFLVEYVALHVKAFHLLMVFFMHLLNVFLYVYRFPVFGTFMFLGEFLLMLYLIYESPAKAALRGLFSALLSFFSFGYMALHTSQTDVRVEELQNTINRLMEENHKLLDQMAEIRLELLRARESEFTLFRDLASHLGGTSAQLQLYALVGLILVIFLLGVSRIARRVSIRCGKDDKGEFITLESHMPHSKLTPAATPPGVVKVVDAETSMPLGTASVVNLPEAPNSVFIVTAEHVVKAVDKVKIGLASGQWFGLPRDYIDLGRDMAAYEVKKTNFLAVARHGDTAFSKSDLLKLSNKAAVGPVTVFSDGKMSTGVLSALADKFGVLTYSGSTEKGFSGAPYLSGNMVMGVHTSGTSAYNMGIDAAYVRARLLRYLDVSRLTDVHIEGSDTVEWLVEEVSKNLRNKKKIKWSRMGDDFDVQINGKYFTVDVSDAIRMGIIEGEAPATISYADVGDFSDNDPRFVREKYDTNPSYNDSENSKRGSVLVQAPGAKKELDTVPGPSSTNSSGALTFDHCPQESTSPSTSHLLSTIAQLASLLPHTQQNKTPAARWPAHKHVVMSGKRQKVAAERKKGTLKVVQETTTPVESA